MLTIGNRVKEAIDCMNRGQLEHALTQACIALDVTAKKVLGKDRIGKSSYKNFVSDNMWLISYMGLPRIMANTIKVHFSHPDITKVDATGCCGIEEIVYHVIRCSLIHSTGLDNDKIQWSNETLIGTDNSGNLILSNKFIWGLLGAIIFCPINQDESIEPTYWISIDDFKFFIQEVWGRIYLVERIIAGNSRLK